jgi:hypothetical protein
MTNEDVLNRFRTFRAVKLHYRGVSIVRKEEEIVEAEEKIQIFTEQIASGDGRSDSIETMEEIRQLERVTVAAGAMTLENVEDAPVAALARRMR